MYLKAIAALTLTIAAAPASAGSVNADTFYRMASELTGKGMAAMFDKRTKPAMNQMKAAATAVKAENEAASKRGAPIYCVPENARKKDMQPKDIVSKLGAIPAQRRKSMTLTKAWREVLVRDYPCT